MTSAVGWPIATSRAKEGPESTAIGRPGTIAARSLEIGRPHRGSSPLVADTTAAVGVIEALIGASTPSIQ